MRDSPVFLQRLQIADFFLKSSGTETKITPFSNRAKGRAGIHHRESGCRGTVMGSRYEWGEQTPDNPVGGMCMAFPMKWYTCRDSFSPRNHFTRLIRSAVKRLLKQV